MNVAKKKKMENVNINGIYLIIFLKKKKTKGVNMLVKNIEIFLKKKFLYYYKNLFSFKKYGFLGASVREFFRG